MVDKTTTTSTTELPRHENLFRKGVNKFLKAIDGSNKWISKKIFQIRVENVTDNEMKTEKPEHKDTFKEKLKTKANILNDFEIKLSLCRITQSLEDCCDIFSSTELYNVIELCTVADVLDVLIDAEENGSRFKRNAQYYLEPLPSQNGNFYGVDYSNFENPSNEYDEQYPEMPPNVQYEFHDYPQGIEYGQQLPPPHPLQEPPQDMPYQQPQQDHHENPPPVQNLLYINPSYQNNQNLPNYLPYPVKQEEKKENVYRMSQISSHPNPIDRLDLFTISENNDDLKLQQTLDTNEPKNEKLVSKEDKNSMVQQKLSISESVSPNKLAEESTASSKGEVDVNDDKFRSIEKSDADKEKNYEIIEDETLKTENNEATTENPSALNKDLNSNNRESSQDFTVIRADQTNQDFRPKSKLNTFASEDVQSNQQTMVNPCFYPYAQPYPFRQAYPFDGSQMLKVVPVTQAKQPQIQQPVLIMNPPMYSFVPAQSPYMQSYTSQMSQVANSPYATVQASGPNGQYYMCAPIPAPSNNVPNVAGLPGVEVRTTDEISPNFQDLMERVGNVEEKRLVLLLLFV